MQHQHFLKNLLDGSLQYFWYARRASTQLLWAIYIFVYNPGYIPPCLIFSDMLALLLMEVCSRGAGLTFSSGYVSACALHHMPL